MVVATSVDVVASVGVVASELPSELEHAATTRLAASTGRMSFFMCPSVELLLKIRR
jgi:hypothetical protein